MSNYKTRLDQLEASAPGAYQKSGAVLDAQKALSDYEGKKPGAYTSKYQEQLDGLLDKLSNRKFDYDFNQDALYQQYKDKYAEQGRQAAVNAAASASALTGGYGNSYATSAAAQANQQYLTALNDKLPDLYSLAMARYQTDGNDLATLYGLYQGADATDYGRYQDNVTDYYNYLNYLTQKENTAYNRDYTEWGDKVNRYNTDRDYLYTGYRGDVADEQWAKELAENRRQFDANMVFNREQLAQQLAIANAKAAGSASSEKAASSSDGDKSAYSRWYKTLDSKQKKTANNVFSSAQNVQGYINNASGHGRSAAETYNYAKQAVNSGVITADQLDRYMTMAYGRR